jgi:Protein of unknown function (DUF1553)
MSLTKETLNFSKLIMRVPLVKKEYVEKRDSQLARIKEIEQLLKDGAATDATQTTKSAEPAGVAGTATTLLDQEHHKHLEQERENLQHEVLPAPPTALAVQDGGTLDGVFPIIGDVPVHIGGRYDQLGNAVPRHLPTFFCGDEQEPVQNGSGRLELANWIANPKNPLTARVIVNRVWLTLFGQGLAPTPNNFGLLGESPSHPELLDWLASRFLEQH